MKIFKKCFLLVAVLALSIAFAAIARAADSEYGLVVNGEAVVFEEEGTVPININGRLLFPLRTLFEYIDDGEGSLEWVDEERMVTLCLGDIELKLWIGDPEAEINGEKAEILDGVAPVIHNDRTYLPLRFVAETFGMVVGWNDEYRTASVTDEAAYEVIMAALGADEGFAGKLAEDIVAGLEDWIIDNFGEEVLEMALDSDLDEVVGALVGDLAADDFALGLSGNVIKGFVFIPSELAGSVLEPGVEDIFAILELKLPPFAVEYAFDGGEDEAPAIGEWAVVIVTDSGEETFTSAAAAELTPVTVEATSVGKSGESTAVYTGVKLSDILAFAGVEDFESLKIEASDGFSAEYDKELALDGETILAWEKDGNLLDAPQTAIKSGPSNQFVKATVKITVN